MKRYLIWTAIPLLLLAARDSYPRGFGGGFHAGGGAGFDRPGGGLDGGGYHPSYEAPRSEPRNDYHPDYRPSYVPQERPAAPQIIRPAQDAFRGQDLNLGDRSGFNPNLRPDWTSAGDRTNIGNRTNIGDIGNRNVVNNINRTNINVNRANWSNKNVNWRDSWANGYYHGYRNGYWNGVWHPWVNGYWGWPGGYPYGWGLLAAGAAAGLDPVYVYYNPYYAAPADPTAVPAGLNYSQPLQQPPAQPDSAGGAVSSNTPPPPPAVPDQAEQSFEAARQAFKQGDFKKAQELDDKAIASLPSDATLHEFRAATLFAQGKYPDAAGTIYAVLAAGPGWDWDTMKSLYPDVAIYTKQLRALEAYSRSNTKDTAAHFLLAYEYLVLGYPDWATKELESVVKLDPKDRLSAELLKGLRKQASTEVAPMP